MTTPTTAGRRRTVLIAAALVAALALGMVTAVVRPWVPPSGCQPTPARPQWSVARMWDEALLDAIRRALPNPPVHARNLFHISVAMWDAWAVYEPKASGYLTTEKVRAADPPPHSARRSVTRHIGSSLRDSASRSAPRRRSASSTTLMESLCYPIDNQAKTGDSPAALGNRIGDAVLAYGKTDGSNEAGGYSDPDYKPVNPPLVVNKPGTTMVDPNRWQPLQIEHMICRTAFR